KVDLERLVYRAVSDLRHDAAEGLEVIRLGLVHQDVAIGKEEDPLLETGLPETPDDLERDESLSRAGRHHQQDAVLPFGDRFNDAVNRFGLVITRRLSAGVRVVVLLHHGLLNWIDTLPPAVPRPQLSGRGELVEAQFPFNRVRV